MTLHERFTNLAIVMFLAALATTSVALAVRRHLPGSSVPADAVVLEPKSS